MPASRIGSLHSVKIEILLALFFKSEHTIGRLARRLKRSKTGVDQAFTELRANGLVAGAANDPGDLRITNNGREKILPELMTIVYRAAEPSRLKNDVDVDRTAEDSVRHQLRIVCDGLRIKSGPIQTTKDLARFLSGMMNRLPPHVRTVFFASPEWKTITGYLRIVKRA